MRGLQFGPALVVLGPDVQQAHARVRKAKAVAGVGRPHQRELQQVGRVGLDVGADVQHDVEAAGIARGPETGDGGAVDAGQLAQPDHRQGHQRAGIAAAHGHRRLMFPHAFDGRPHGGVAAMAHDLAGLVLHRHHARGMADRAARRDVGALGQKARQLLLGAVQDEVHIGDARRRLGQAADHGRRATVAPHRVYGYDNAARQPVFPAIRRHVCP